MPEVENFLDFEMCSKMNFSLEYYLTIIIGKKSATMIKSIFGTTLDFIIVMI